MATINRHIFPFLSLAREIRDLIYVHTTRAKQQVNKAGSTDVFHPGRDSYLRLYVTNSPLKSPQLICRQIRTEYLETIAERVSLCYEDCFALEIGLTPVPEALKALARRNLTIMPHDCDDLDAIMTEFKSSKTRNLSLSATLKVFLKASSKESKDSLSDNTKDPLIKLATDLDIGYMVLFRYQQGEDFKSSDEAAEVIEEEEKCMRTWTKAKGWESV